MESALVRQPRVSPAPPRAGRALRIALGVAGTALAASVVLLQPFAATHLFPGRRVASPAAPAPAPPADVKAALGDLPTRGKSASAPPRLPPALLAADRAEPIPMPAGASPAPLAVAVVSLPPAALPAAEPVAHAAAPPAATGDSRPTPAPALATSALATPALAMPATPAAEPTAPRFGAPPPPREPLPLETDLIGPDSPGANARARPAPIPPRGIAPDAKPAAAGPHG